MSSTEDRINALAREHLGQDLDFEAGFGDSDVNSVDAVAFLKKVGENFGVPVGNENIAQFQSLRDLVNFLDSNG